MGERRVVLTDRQIEYLAHLAKRMGRPEAEVLEEALERGLWELRLDQAVEVWEQRGTAQQAAEAGDMRVIDFYEHMGDRNVPMIGPEGADELPDRVRKLSEIFRKAEEDPPQG
jgi:predicted DNA-binding protein